MQRDLLSVALDPHVLDKVIKYLQHAGFSSVLQEVNKKRKGMSSHIPQGIWIRKDHKGSSYFVTKDNNNKLKKCQTLNDAVSIVHCVHNHGDDDAKPNGYHEDEPHEGAIDAGDEV